MVRNKPKAKTVIETQSAIDRFVQFAGVNRVSRIDDTAPARFRDWLLENGNRRSKQSSTLKSRSVKKLIGLVCAVVQTGCDDKYVRHNPFAGLRFPEFKDTTERQRFSVDQLKQFFASPVYTEAYRPVGGAGEAAFWLPLLGLFGGGRETEHGQPRLADIREENGTHYIEVTDTGEEQSLKNDASKRYVPIHAELVRIGFLRYVEWLRRRGETVLFPELRPDSHGALLGCWSKWFNRYLDDIVGIDALGFDYHSLRHTFKHFGRECGMDDNVLDRLQGHAPASEGAKYGGTYPLKRLVAELSLYRIPGLDLGRLTRHPPTGQEPKRRRARRPWSA
jgi:integrase